MRIDLVEAAAYVAAQLPDGHVIVDVWQCCGRTCDDVHFVVELDDDQVDDEGVGGEASAELDRPAGHRRRPGGL